MKPVLIVGAGPTGLFLSYLLKKRGIDVRLIDKGGGPSIHSKAIGIHSRTMEILYKEGLGKEFQMSGLEIQALHFHERSKDAILPFDDLAITYPFVLSLPQTETERLLIGACEKLGIEVEWDSEVTGYEGTKPIVNGKPLDFEWVIGCDGAHSVTRKSHQNYTFLGKPLNEQVFLADVLADSPYAYQQLHVIFQERLVSMILPMSKERFRIMFAHKSEQEFQESDLPLLLEKYQFDPKFKINKTLWINNFKLSERMVNTFRQGNLFILGDAAHVHSPFLGQGMNTCFQDAYNLAWKLELVIKGRASEKLLDSFDQERLPIVRNMLRKTSALTHALATEKVPLPFLFKMIRGFTRFDKIRKALVKNVSMVSLGYKRSSITVEEAKDRKWRAPSLGFPFPNVAVGRGSKLFDHLTTDKHLLVHFDENSHFKNNDFFDVLYIQDAQTQKELAAQSESFFLIRPDGHLGLRSSKGNSALINDYLDRLHYSKDRKGVVVNI